MNVVTVQRANSNSHQPFLNKLKGNFRQNKLGVDIEPSWQIEDVPKLKVCVTFHGGKRVQ
jgi:hypothetical protein